LDIALVVVSLARGMSSQAHLYYLNQLQAQPFLIINNGVTQCLILLRGGLS